ncbi:hypothetical protein [Halorhabdus tiamatea]|nr:hypothetical protein [Halorhabdus tiamatea]
MNKDEIRARVTAKAWRWHRQNKLPVTVQVLSQQGIPTHERGAAKTAIREMCDEGDAPITWEVPAEDMVGFVDKPRDELQGFVRSYLLRNGFDEDDLPWDLR